MQRKQLVMLSLIQQVCRQQGGYFSSAAEVRRAAAAAASFAFMALCVLALPGLSLDLALDWRAIKVFSSGMGGWRSALMEFPTSHQLTDTPTGARPKRCSHASE